ncbi:MAG: F-box protein [Candidatus Dojkabacteria bacterium]|nr:F-box protein [Candidatus Dojkabacteria bacterium]
MNIQQLPNELIYAISKNLDLESFINFSKTCKRFKILSKDKKLLEKILKKDFLNILEKNKKLRNDYIEYTKKRFNDFGNTNKIYYDEDIKIKFIVPSNSLNEELTTKLNKYIKFKEKGKKLSKKDKRKIIGYFKNLVKDYKFNDIHNWVTDLSKFTKFAIIKLHEDLKCKIPKGYFENKKTK